MLLGVIRRPPLGERPPDPNRVVLSLDRWLRESGFSTERHGATLVYSSRARWNFWANGVREATLSERGLELRHHIRILPVIGWVAIGSIGGAVASWMKSPPRPNPSEFLALLAIGAGFVTSILCFGILGFHLVLWSRVRRLTRDESES